MKMRCDYDRLIRKGMIPVLLLATVGCSKGERDTRRPGSKNTVNTTESFETSCISVGYEYWEASKYVLPYPVGKTYKTNRTHCSTRSHAPGEPDQYALDFGMGIGTIVTAAREGRVVFVEESGEPGEFPNNLVVIEHDDGTFAQYMHLDYQGAFVKVGQSVSQGDEIALSGDTGPAGYPHLHFVVTKNDSFEYPYKSIPTTFKNTKPNQQSLEPYTDYPAYPY